jgi:hypothetical protein
VHGFFRDREEPLQLVDGCVYSSLLVIDSIDRIKFFLIDLLSADKYILGVQVLGIMTLMSDFGGWFSSSHG